MSSEFLARYLKILGVRSREPSLEALSEVIQAHLYRIPFENISKLYYKKHRGLRGIPDLDTYLEGIEYFHFGGTCYSNNFYLYRLLSTLGYEVKLCGADMSSSDVHLLGIVTLGGREYLVDVGYAAPFWAPMPRDLEKDYSINLGSERYVLKPQDAEGRSRMELYRDGSLEHGYLAKPQSRQIREFEGPIDDSFRDDQTFMNALLVARFSPESSLVICNLTLTEYGANSVTSRELTSRDDAVKSISDRFMMPGTVVEDAVAELGTLRSTRS
jgi:arylamine N-acetyltransferase